MNEPTRFVERIRHELRFRVAQVIENARITPRFARITLQCDDFESFSSLAYDDHCKMFFPAPGQTQFPAPEVSPEKGLIFPAGQRPESRDYTPRYFDNAARTVTFDFVLHGDGPASTWAKAAKPGDTVGVGGPRGSFVLRGSFDWYLLVGDETALPAIARRLEELPADATALAIIEVADNAEIQTIEAPANAQIHWLSREGAEPGDPAPLLDAVRTLPLPAGAGYAFIAGETKMSKAVRSYLVDEKGHNPDWIKAAGYWQAGTGNFDDGHAH